MVCGAANGGAAVGRLGSGNTASVSEQRKDVVQRRRGVAGNRRHWAKDERLTSSPKTDPMQCAPK